MLNIFFKALKDLVNKKIFITSLIPLLIAASIWGILFYLLGKPINSFIESLLSYVPLIGESHWFQSAVESIGGVLLYYELVIMTSVMIVGIIADKIVDIINDKYYHNKKRGFGTTTGSVLIALKQNVIFFILLIITFPLLFIPVLNIFIHIFLWFILIKKPNFYDSVAMYTTKDEYKKLQTNNRLMTNGITFISASLFLIPVIGVFIYIVQLLMFTHFNLQRLKELRQ